MLTLIPMARDDQKTVLLVVDDIHVRELYRKSLADAGYGVIGLSSAVEAVRRVEELALDAVVLDVDLPGLDARMALSLINARCPILPLILLSTSIAAVELDSSRIAKVSDVLRKPCLPNLLLAAVSRATAGNSPPNLAA